MFNQKIEIGTLPRHFEVLRCHGIIYYTQFPIMSAES